MHDASSVQEVEGSERRFLKGEEDVEYIWIGRCCEYSHEAAMRSADLRASAEASETKLGSYKNLVSHLKPRHMGKDATERIDGLESRIKDLERLLADAQVDNQSLKNERNELDNRLTQVENYRDDLEDEVVELRDRNESLSRELNVPRDGSVSNGAASESGPIKVFRQSVLDDSEQLEATTAAKEFFNSYSQTDPIEMALAEMTPQMEREHDPDGGLHADADGIDINDVTFAREAPEKSIPELRLNLGALRFLPSGGRGLDTNRTQQDTARSRWDFQPSARNGTPRMLLSARPFPDEIGTQATIACADGEAQVEVQEETTAPPRATIKEVAAAFAHRMLLVFTVVLVICWSAKYLRAYLGFPDPFDQIHTTAAAGPSCKGLHTDMFGDCFIDKNVMWPPTCTPTYVEVPISGTQEGAVQPPPYPTLLAFLHRALDYLAIVVMSPLPV